MTKFNSFKSKWLLVPLVLFTLNVWNAWGANQTYTLVAQGDLSSLSSTDKVLIVCYDGSSNYYALQNGQKTSNSNLPETSVTITSNTITADLETDYTWYLEFIDNVTISGNSYPSFYIKSTKGTYYLQNSGNTGSIINAKSATDGYNVWVIGYQGSFTNKQGTFNVTGLWNSTISRMLVHLSSDWRCYQSDSWNTVGGRVVSIYKMQVDDCDDDPTIGTASLNGTFL